MLTEFSLQSCYGALWSGSQKRKGKVHEVKQVTKPVAPNNKVCWLVFVGSVNKWAFVKATVWMKSQRAALACPQRLRHSMSTGQPPDLHSQILLLILFFFGFIIDSWGLCIALFINVVPRRTVQYSLRTITAPWHYAWASSFKAIDTALSWAGAYPNLSPSRYFLCLLNMWGKEAIYFEAVII